MSKVKADHADRIVFVAGDTKKISDCNESDLEVLRKNYPQYFEANNSEAIAEADVVKDVPAEEGQTPQTTRKNK